MERIRRNGAPVILSSAPWSKETKKERFKRGPQKPAHEFVEFLGTKFLDFLRKGYWMLLPHNVVKDMVITATLLFEWCRNQSGAPE
jgi:hypothetical protein